ncbi:hypothetical protein EYF80_033480 [Liparis tanakae]|uniref:Uncharacterized protein n=1 Tax=Liparis tanakae TaxID=230148 RepID=A0A4Z2GUK5_9TELE|nr:hypothetical protein EYF80_033480 [Liparis tanakae]
MERERDKKQRVDPLGSVVNEAELLHGISDQSPQSYRGGIKLVQCPFETSADGGPLLDDFREKSSREGIEQPAAYVPLVREHSFKDRQREEEEEGEEEEEEESGGGGDGDTRKAKEQGRNG